MCCCQRVDCSSDDSHESNIESCFDTKDEESDTNTEEDDEANISWLLDEDKDHPPKYYLNQENEFDES
jgi:hypothetical protein